MNKILVIRLSSLGDIVLSFPFLKKLREKFPAAEIHFISKEAYADLIKLNNNISSVKIFEGDLKKSRREIKHENYDLIIDLHKNFRSYYLSLFNAGRVIRYKKGNFEKFLLVAFKINLIKNVIPVYKKYLLTIKEFLEEEDIKFTVSNLLFSKDKIVEGNYVAVAPSSRHFTKTYPKEKFSEFINENKNTKFILIGDKSENDISICGFIESMCPDVLNLCGKLNMKSLLSVLYNSDYVISNDSAIMHLAEAVGKKTLAVFGSTIKEFGFFPQLVDSFVLENKNLKCRPCSHIGKKKCPEGHFKCMDMKLRNIF